MPKILNEKQLQGLQSQAMWMPEDEASLFATISALRSVVKGLEWSDMDDAWCRVCGNYQSDGHASGCKLAEALGGE